MTVIENKTADVVMLGLGYVGLPVACLRGRLHMYEGLSERLVVEPALLMGRLGAPVLLLTNASGGVNPAFSAGTLMVMTPPQRFTKIC